MNFITIICMGLIGLAFVVVVVAFIINNNETIKYEQLFLVVALMGLGIAGLCYNTNSIVSKTTLEQQEIGYNHGYDTAITEFKNTITLTSIGAGTITLGFGDGTSDDYTYSYMPDSNEEGNGFGSVKTYEGYHMITDTTASQYRLNNLSEVWTDDNGMRRIHDYYLVAMGTFYGSIGDIFEVTLDTGRIILVIKGDTKADQHTNESNKAHAVDGSVIEFIVDQPVLESKLNGYGDCSYIPGFEGSITNIELVGHYNF